MTQFLKSKLRTYRKDEDGSMVVPVALWVPFLLLFLLSALEMGKITVGHTVLERALDQTVRDIRLGTGEAVSHDSIKAAICGRTSVLINCMDNIHLEMINRDLRAWQALDPQANCVDQPEDAEPVRDFVNGQDNQLMVLRACYTFIPLMPTSELSNYLLKNSEGESALVASSAFVQEPR